jgi:superfamily II DNA or RNA helicase
MNNYIVKEDSLKTCDLDIVDNLQIDNRDIANNIDINPLEMFQDIKKLLHSTCISTKGVAIYKNKIPDPKLLDQIKTDLTITPFVCPGYGSEDDLIPYKLFLENADKIYVPYYYAVTLFGNIPPKTKIANPYQINIQFSSERKMRPYQQDIIKTYMNSAKAKGGGIISVGCGRGKTVMALKILEELKVKTLILVHKEFLMNQWVERIGEYLPDAKIGYIQGKTLDIRDKDIVLAMIQSLSDPRKDKDYPVGIFEGFGLVIADECHHLAAKQFCRALAKYTFKYTLGLSATPNRADGLAKVFKWYLGDIVYKDSEIQKSEEDKALDHIPNSTVQIYKYNNRDIKYCKEELNYQKKPNVVIMKSNIAKCLKRTNFLLSFIPKLIEEGRTILLLSCRRDHIFQMEKLINNMNIENCSVGLYLGGMKQEDLDISATKRVIIATFNMAEEAFDCKTLNTLIYATPHNNIEQAVGRILREEKKRRAYIPLIIDLQDMFSSFNKWNKTREKYYTSKGYPMTFYDVDNNTETATIKINENITTKLSKQTNRTKHRAKHTSGLRNDNDDCVHQSESSSEELDF